MFTKLITPAVVLGIFLVGFLAIGHYDPYNEMAVLAPTAVEAVGDLTVPSLTVPSLDGAPTLSAPTLSTPSLDVPSLDTPSLDVPSLDTPTSGTTVVRTCEILTSASTVVAGGSVTITWKTSGYDKITLNGVEVSGANGWKTFTNIQADTTYKLVATTDDGKYDCTQLVVVKCFPQYEDCTSNSPLWNPGRDLSGFIFDGQKGTVTNTSLYCTYPIGLASYKVYDGTIESQVLFDSDLDTVGPNESKTLMVEVPDCRYQIDLFYGDLVTSFANGDRYGERLLDADQFIQEFCGPVDPVVPTCDLFEANPPALTAGESALLIWETTNASRVVINQGINEVDLDGSVSVTPLDDITYELTVFDAENTIGDTCSVTLTVNDPEPTDVTVVAQKIVCTDEADLPNWGNGGPDITSTTAADWVAAHDSCAFASDWSFQYAPATSPDPGDTLVGEAAAPWTTFGPTNASGRTSVTLDATTPISQLWFREVLKTGYIPFSHGTHNNSNIDDVSAEFYCHVDSLNYDNREYINNLTAGDTYYCVAWNVPTTPVDTVPQCVSFAADTTTLPAGGGTVILSWETLRANSASIAPTIGSVAVPNGTTSVLVTSDTTFTLTAVDGDGDQDSCNVTIDVEETEPPVVSCANNVSFSASRTTLQKGDSTTLTWNTTGLKDVSITSISNPGVSGEAVVTPTTDTTYVLSASAVSGESTLQCPLSIAVDEGGGGGGGGGSSSPRCELEISATRIDRGEEVTLTWDTSRATEVSLFDNHGNTIFTTDDYLSDEKDDWFEGSVDLTPEKDTTYTLRAERGSRDRECEVSVEIRGDEVIVIETREQPLVAGIALSQVPYTGFEAGPILTTLFYALLVAWALFVTYVLVIKQDSIGGVSLVTKPVIADVTPVKTPEDIHPTAFVPKEQYDASDTATVAAVASMPAIPVNLPTGDLSAMTAPAALQPTAAPVMYESEIENIAHEAHVLLSSDAIRHFMQSMTSEHDQQETMRSIIKAARAAYPEEDGWVVLNQKRMEVLCREHVPEVSKTSTVAEAAIPMGAGSLAEAIIAGNVAAAYQMIGARPMVALADAAADLDAAYRARQGQSVTISNLLKTETDKLSEVQLKEAIAALTSALDGVYTSEGEAVKMAIMKAVKAVA